mmetsp:Transcript_53813/g.149652  ORF Transcript_53813/g.149652 Transcript_53813/m.149652 type:complete len:204 (-) Transcript_53813:12-623(-)
MTACVCNLPVAARAQHRDEDRAAACANDAQALHRVRRLLAERYSQRRGAHRHHRLPRRGNASIRVLQTDKKAQLAQNKDGAHEAYAGTVPALWEEWKATLVCHHQQAGSRQDLSRHLENNGVASVDAELRNEGADAEEREGTDQSAVNLPQGRRLMAPGGSTGRLKAVESSMAGGCLDIFTHQCRSHALRASGDDLVMKGAFG